MKSLNDYIEYVKGQPHHVRRSVAFGSAGGIAGLVGIVWLSGSLLTGSFHIQGTSFADAGNAGAQVAAPSDSGVAGAAASFASAEQKARIEIVDTSSSTAAAQTPEPTIIPF